jgi:SAM-dependent methyltransferase
MSKNKPFSDEQLTMSDYRYELGGPVLELLNPKSKERILDLGCGDGKLTKELVDLGCNVTGIDSDPEMIEKAKALGIDARIGNAEQLVLDEKFDAVMSNASLHWMKDQYGVVQGIWDALKPGGRFAAECGGEGCIRIIREGLKIALIKRGLEYKARNPWKYPELGTFSGILENRGFKINYIARIDRPTPLPKGLRHWLEVFTASHTRGFSEDEKNFFYNDVEKYCRPLLYTEKDGWIADHVRLRILAEKPLVS